MKFLFFVILFVSHSWASAQNLYSSGGGVIYLKPLSAASPANLKRGSYVGPHVLGDSVTHLLNNFEREYVYPAVGPLAYYTYIWGNFVYWGAATLIYALLRLNGISF